MIILETILSVLFVILKILGIILLAILGLALFVVCTVLFVPIRYKAGGEFDSSHFDGEVKITWLLHLLSFKIWFKDNKPGYMGKLFGIKIINSEKIKNTTEKPDKKEKPQNIKNQNRHDAIKSPETVDNTVNNNSNQPQSGNNHKEEKEIITGTTDKKPEDEKKSFKEKVSEKINNIKFKFITICDKIRNVNGIKDRYVEFLTTKESREAMADIKSRLFKILCHIKPLKIKGYFKFGFPDPSVTGQVYGIICILLCGYGKGINIEPQFVDVEKVFAEGNFKLKGRIRLIILLIHAIKIYTNKRLKEFIAFIKGWKVEEKEYGR